MSLLPFAAGVSRRNVEDLARSALPHAPVVPEPPRAPATPATRRIRLALAGVLHRVGDAVTPAAV